ncbi:hypothetical protein ACLB1M_28170 [Escherichia coli]
MIVRVRSQHRLSMKAAQRVTTAFRVHQSDKDEANGGARQRADVPVVTDQQWLAVDSSQYGLPKEPMPQELIAAVSPANSPEVVRLQAGIIVGKDDRLQSHPLKRRITRG